MTMRKQLALSLGVVLQIRVETSCFFLILRTKHNEHHNHRVFKLLEQTPPGHCVYHIWHCAYHLWQWQVTQNHTSKTHQRTYQLNQHNQYDSHSTISSAINTIHTINTMNTMNTSNTFNGIKNMNQRGNSNPMSKRTSKFMQLINDYENATSTQPMRCMSALTLQRKPSCSLPILRTNTPSVNAHYLTVFHQITVLTAQTVHTVSSRSTC